METCITVQVFLFPPGPLEGIKMLNKWLLDPLPGAVDIFRSTRTSGFFFRE